MVVKVKSLHLISFFLLENLRNKLVIFDFFFTNDVINYEHTKNVETLIFVFVQMYIGPEFHKAYRLID